MRARVVLEEARALGLNLEDLLAAAQHEARCPTLAEHVEAVGATFSPGTARTYRPYWRLATAMYGSRRLYDLGITEMQAVVDAAVARARRRSDGAGQSTRETCVAALRALYGRAVLTGIVSSNPAAALPKPRRPRPRRRALDERELAELIDAVRATSADPSLDLLLVRFHLETGARRSGGLALRVADLDERRSTVWLTEKGSTREQPVSPNLLAALQRQAVTRGSSLGVFLRLDGRPVTARSYDRLFSAARTLLPWSARVPVSTHVLRHTAITAIGRIAGYPVAQAFAGHSPTTVTGRYLHASLAEVAGAVAVMTGEGHPLAEPADRLRRACLVRNGTGAARRE